MLAKVHKSFRTPAHFLATIRHNSTKAAKEKSSAALDELFRRPSWSTKSMLSTGEDGTDGADPVTVSQLEHLLKLSALPTPQNTRVQQRMLKDLGDQLNFVNEVRKVDTRGVKPLRNITADQSEDDLLDYDRAIQYGQEMDDRADAAAFDYPEIASQRRNRHYTVEGGLVNDKEKAKV